VILSKYKKSIAATFLCVFFLTLTPSTHAADGDTQLIDKVGRDSFRYFLEYTPEKTGLTRDSSRPGSPCSVAGVGFYLASLVVATENNWISRKKAYMRAYTALNTLAQKGEREHGFFYHFLDPHSGRRTWGSEASSIDTALLLAGALVAAEYFKGSHVEKIANKLYEEVDWKWMTNGTDLINHGYKPETGFLQYYWDIYSEHLIMQALALGSPTHPLPLSAWKAWRRDTEERNNRSIVYSYSGSLFTYQYPQTFIDFRTLQDNGINYFDNSRYATEENKRFCEEHQSEYATYKAGYWGLTASLGPHGYKAYGAEPGNPFHDGTVAPYGAIAAMPFTPTESLLFMHKLYDEHRQDLYGRCGFKDAFNLDKNWFAREYLSIDQGITVLMIENYKTERVWELFMKHDSVQRWIDKCGLQE